MMLCARPENLPPEFETADSACAKRQNGVHPTSETVLLQSEIGKLFRVGFIGCDQVMAG